MKLLTDHFEKPEEPKQRRAPRFPRKNNFRKSPPTNKGEVAKVEESENIEPAAEEDTPLTDDIVKPIQTNTSAAVLVNWEKERESWTIKTIRRQIKFTRVSACRLPLPPSIL